MPSNPNSAEPVDTPQDGLRRLYGRRQAFKLRDRQAQLIEELLPRLALEVPDEGELDLAALFPGCHEIHLEIGFGGGEHLVAQAKAHPHAAFIGAEPFINGMAKILTKIDDEKVTNIRLLPGDARVLLEKLPAASLSRVYILFPDPWPKSRHHKRRMVQTWVLDLIARALRDDGELRVASDIPGYIAWTLERALPHPAFNWTAERRDDWAVRGADWPPTRYEQKALKAGRVPAYLSFRRLPR